jgi:hypothetical protein
MIKLVDAVQTKSSEGNDYMKLMLPDILKLMTVMILQYVITKR